MRQHGMEYEIEYFVNEEKKVVVCKISNCMASLQCDMCKLGWPHHPDLFINDTFVGKARCSEDDTFDVETGKYIAYKRAVAKLNTAKLKVVKRFRKNQERGINELFKSLDKISGKYERIIAAKESEIEAKINTVEE